MVLPHRLALALVLIAFAATASVVLVARPEADHPGTTITGTAYPAPSHGWTWTGGQPGFLPLTGHEDWNISEVGEHELDGARFDARLTPVQPETVKLLTANRLGPRDLELLLSGSDRQGSTCIGAALPPRPAEFFCPSSTGTHRLARQVAFVIVAARPPFPSRGKPEFPYFVEGVARGDVVRVESESPSLETVVHHDGTSTLRPRSGQEAFHPKSGWWGTFGYTFTNAYLPRPPTKPWRARLSFYCAKGVLATLDLRLDRPGGRLYAVTP